jgi:hypothetical protein
MTVAEATGFFWVDSELLSSPLESSEDSREVSFEFELLSDELFDELFVLLDESPEPRDESPEPCDELPESPEPCDELPELPEPCDELPEPVANAPECSEALSWRAPRAPGVWHALAASRIPTHAAFDPEVFMQVHHLSCHYLLLNSHGSSRLIARWVSTWISRPGAQSKRK